MSPTEYFLCPNCPESHDISETEVEYNEENDPSCPNCGNTLITRIND